MSINNVNDVFFSANNLKGSVCMYVCPFVFCLFGVNLEIQVQMIFKLNWMQSIVF